jgi:hypothetical protein
LRVSWLLARWWPRLFFFFTLPLRPPFPNTMLFPVCCSREGSPVEIFKNLTIYFSKSVSPIRN